VFGTAFQSDPAAALREQGPVFYSEASGWYVVTRHEDIRAIYKDTESFSSRIFAEPITPLCPAAQAKLEEYDFKPARNLGTLDDPIHSLRRKRLAEPYQPKSMPPWEPRVRAVQTEYIDRFVARGSADIVAEMFWEAPAVVAMEFMGIPEADVAQVKQFAAGVINFIFGRPTEEEQVATCDLLGQHQQYARELIVRLLKDPSGDGILQYAVRAYQAEPDLFDEDFLVSLGMNTLAAAHETTSGSLGNGLLLLLRNRKSWDALCADPALIPGAVEECLRRGPSLTTGRRLCVRETTVGDVRIPEGAKVVLGVAAGNCDDALFDDPETFDIERANAKRHFTFGYGSHACLGAPLARLQMRTAFEELTRRLPHMRLVEDQQIEFVPSSSARAPSALWIEWDPTQNPVPADRPA
jgi:cytochrome P450